MTGRVSFTTDAAGRRIAAKVARDASEAALLSREASMLDAARHPGVVELVGIEGHQLEAMLLTTEVVDGVSLRQAGPLRIDERAGLLAAVAATLADLHELGLVHGAVCPDHVLLGPGGRPLLCGFGYGGRQGEARLALPAIEQDFVDPVSGLDQALDPTVDVFGLGALAAFLAPDLPAGHILPTVAADATCPDPMARPTARAVAGTLRRAFPVAQLPRTSTPAATLPPQAAVAGDPLRAWRNGVGREAGRRMPARVLVAAGVGVAVLTVGTIALTRRRNVPTPGLAVDGSERAGDLPALPIDEARSGPTTTRVGPASPTLAPADRRDCPLVGGLLQADIDGDGCPEALRYADGVIEAGAARWSVGRAGDQVATGDWGCQGTRTVALFRPSTGEVFRFDAWAGIGNDLAATMVGVVAGGQALRAADVDHDGCHEVVVERPTGPADVIRFPRPQR